VPPCWRVEAAGAVGHQACMHGRVARQQACLLLHVRNPEGAHPATWECRGAEDVFFFPGSTLGPSGIGEITSVCISTDDSGGARGRVRCGLQARAAAGMLRAGSARCGEAGRPLVVWARGP